MEIISSDNNIDNSTKYTYCKHIRDLFLNSNIFANSFNYFNNLKFTRVSLFYNIAYFIRIIRFKHQHDQTS